MASSASEPRVVGQLLAQQAERFAERPFLRWQDREVTLAGLDRRANELAHGFLDLGTRTGDTVCLMLPNCPELVFAWLALAKIGAVEVPINTAHRGALLTYIVNHSDAATIVADRPSLGHLTACADDLRHLRTVAVYPDLAARDGIPAVPGWRYVGFGDLAWPSAPAPEIDVQPHDLLGIFYTGGTTGPSKGVMISHNFAVWSSRGLPRYDEVVADDVYYCCLPLFHAIQLRAVLGPLISGATLALTDRFSASRFWEEVRRFRATTFMFVGAMLPILWAQQPHPDDAANPIRFATGNPIPPDLQRPFEERFGFPLLQSYAMTEAMPISRNPLGRSKVGSSGVPVPGGYEVRVFDEHDVEVPCGTVGEFVVRPREPFTIMNGYYKMPEETLRVFRNLWFHTGDRGYMDADGYLFFAGRAKDMIRRSGENISAQEVEDVVNGHPAVLESAAVAVPSEIHGEEVKVVVVLRPGQSCSPEELLDHCERRMAYFMVPRYVEFAAELPRTAIFRIEKYRLREAGVSAATWDRERAGYRLRRD